MTQPSRIGTAGWSVPSLALGNALGLARSRLHQRGVKQQKAESK
jgi:hypothetical protein